MTSRARSLYAAVLVAAAGSIVLLTSCGTSPRTPPADRSASRAPTTATLHLTAHAVPGHCTGRIGAVSVDGDVTVPNRATCDLLGTRVEGNVSVGHAGRLYARGVDVDGDVEGERTTAVEITGSIVGGNVQLESGGAAFLIDSHVDGDLSWQDQHRQLLARGDTVGGNVDLGHNIGRATLSDNTIGGDLSCQDNNSAPRGEDNTVGGDEEDQCRGL